MDMPPPKYKYVQVVRQWKEASRRSILKAIALLERKDHTITQTDLMYMGERISKAGMKGVRLAKDWEKFEWDGVKTLTKIWDMCLALEECSGWLRKAAEKRGVPTELFPVFFSPLGLHDHPRFGSKDRRAGQVRGGVKHSGGDQSS